MTAFAMFIFACSLLGIIGLFVLKAWETHSGSMLAPMLRKQADMRAVQLKIHLLNSCHKVSKIAPFLILLNRYLVHEAAIGIAIAAHWLGVQAHRLADFVSHKHRFERQPPRSEYLKQVAQITERAAAATMSERASAAQNHHNTTIEKPISAPMPVHEQLGVVAIAVAERTKKTPVKKPRTKKKPRPSKFTSSLRSDIVDRSNFEY